MNIWSRSWLYRAYVILGFPAVIAVAVITSLSAEPGEQATRPAIIAVGVFVGGLLLLQWHRVLADRRDAAGTLNAELYRRLSLRAVSEEEPQRRAGATFRFAAVGGVFLTALVAAVVGGGIASTEGDGQSLAPFLPALALAAVGAVLSLTRLGRAVRIGNDWLEPLGLTTTAIPRRVVVPFGDNLRLAGDTHLEGRRHGRDVHVALGTGGSRVAIATPVPDFELAADDGALRGRPAWAAAVATAARTGSIWRGVRAQGSADGITVVRAGQAATTSWLADLWLAEQLAAAAPSPATA